MRQKLVFCGLVSFLLFFSCKKYIQQQEQNAALKIITNGTWYVKQYLQDTVDITSTLAGFNFQFYANGTVVGSNGTVSVTGTWAANVTNLTITSAFPANSGALNELNAVWNITNSTNVSVQANAQINSNTDYLLLQKN